MRVVIDPVPALGTSLEVHRVGPLVAPLPGWTADRGLLDVAGARGRRTVRVINSRHMTTLRDGRVFFGGDAAHVHSPAGGQGMNAGIQDMINLSWKLAMVLSGQARQELLDTYQSDRLPVIRRLVG